MWSGERLTKWQVTSRARIIYGQNSGEEWQKNAELREKHKWAIEKPKFDNARRLRGIYSIDPEDKEFKETIKNARKKLETTSGSRYALQDKQEQSQNLVVNPIRSNQNLRVSWKPVNPQDCVWENLYRIIMKTILQRYNVEMLTCCQMLSICCSWKSRFLCVVMNIDQLSDGKVDLLVLVSTGRTVQVQT